MFNKVKLIMLSSVFAMVSSGAMAHGGHDHSDASSGLIHLAWLTPMLIVGAYISYRIKKSKLAKRNQNEES